MKQKKKFSCCNPEMVYLTEMHKMTILQMIGYGDRTRTQAEVVCPISRKISRVAADISSCHLKGAEFRDDIFTSQDVILELEIDASQNFLKKMNNNGATEFIPFGCSTLYTLFNIDLAAAAAAAASARKPDAPNPIDSDGSGCVLQPKTPPVVIRTLTIQNYNPPNM
ncbi:hypothetical protein NQ318_002455 [Aromia moschata]|uniref:Uncharacterized protein n=1 Tax=Aromia moschata TaxID=1265417 RepID=A0AAV8Y6I6_9CUCU|nr:hypothetical protein NQ318_002455 [Aromia moschata]